MNHAAELAALKRRVEALEYSTPAAIEARRREAQRQEAADEAKRQHEMAENTRRQQELHQHNERQSLENWIAHEKAERAERAANGGRFRSPDGLWRGPDGRQLSNAAAHEAAAVDREQDAAREVRRKQKEERE